MITAEFVLGFYLGGVLATGLYAFVLTPSLRRAYGIEKANEDQTLKAIIVAFWFIMVILYIFVREIEVERQPTKNDIKDTDTNNSSKDNIE